MSEYKNSFDEAKKDMVNRAFIDSENQINDRIQAEAQPHSFSDSHKKKMEKLFADFDAKTAGKAKSSHSWYKIAACIMGFIIAGSSLTIASVGALRKNFLNFVFESGQPNTDFSFGENEGTDYSDDNIILKYVPVGFELAQSEDNTVQQLWVFNRNDEYFQITVSDSSVKLSVDTENASAEQITIQDKSAIFTSNNNINSVIYEIDSKSIIVVGDINKAELIKIANQISFK